MKFADLKKRPATDYFQEYALLPTQCDLSYVAVKYACELSEEGSGIKPNIILAGREDHFVALQLLNGRKKELELLYWSRYDFRSGVWCVGNFKAPLFFVGSEEL